MLPYARSRLMLALNVNAKQWFTAATTTRTYASHAQETDEQFDAKWEAYFKK